MLSPHASRFDGFTFSALLNFQGLRSSHAWPWKPSKLSSHARHLHDVCGNGPSSSSRARHVAYVLTIQVQSALITYTYVISTPFWFTLVTYTSVIFINGQVRAFAKYTHVLAVKVHSWELNVPSSKFKVQSSKFKVHWSLVTTVFKVHCANSTVHWSKFKVQSSKLKAQTRSSSPTNSSNATTIVSTLTTALTPRTTSTSAIYKKLHRHMNMTLSSDN